MEPYTPEMLREKATNASKLCKDLAGEIGKGHTSTLYRSDSPARRMLGEQFEILSKLFRLLAEEDSSSSRAKELKRDLLVIFRITNKNGLTVYSATELTTLKGDYVVSVLNELIVALLTVFLPNMEDNRFADHQQQLLTRLENAESSEETAEYIDEYLQQAHGRQIRANELEPGYLATEGLFMIMGALAYPVLMV